MEVAIYIVFIGLLLAMLVRFDQAGARLAGLTKDGIPCPGWQVVRASRWVNVRTGLLNQARLADRTGLWLQDSKAVHTRGMLFAIDVVFLAGDGQVLAIHADVAPGVGRLVGPKGTRAVLELNAGVATKSIEAGGLGLVPGTRLVMG